MATSSIFHNIVINDTAQAEAFVAALEASEAHPYQRPEGPLTCVATDEEIGRLCDLWRKKHGVPK